MSEPAVAANVLIVSPCYYPAIGGGAIFYKYLAEGLIEHEVVSSVRVLTEAHPGTIVEISDISGTKGRTFAHIRKVAQDWDGSDPIRTFG